MRTFIAILLLLVSLPPARANDWRDCEKGEADRGIAGCSRIINAGQGKKADLAIAYTNRAIHYRGKFDYQAAALDLDKALELHDRNAWIWETRGWNKADLIDRDGALADFDQAIALNAKSDEAWRGRGWVLDAKKDHDGAIEAFTKSVTINPKNAWSWAGRAQTYQWGKADLERALADAEKAVAVDGKVLWILGARADVRAARGDIEGAIGDAARMIALDPSSPDGYVQQGSALRDKGDAPGAIAAYNRAIELNPESSAALNGRAWTFHHIGEHRRTVEDADKAIAIDDAASTRDTRAWGYLGIGQLDKAIEDFNKAIEGDPRQMPSYAGRGLALAKLGRVEEAVRDLDKATSLAPRNKDERDAIEVALMTLKKLREAQTAQPQQTPPAAAPATPPSGAPIKQPAVEEQKQAAPTSPPAETEPVSREEDLTTCFSAELPNEAIPACTRRIDSGEFKARDLGDLQAKLARAWGKKGYFEKEAELLAAARKADPANEEYASLHAEVLRKMKDAPGAKAAAADAVKIDPKSARALVYRALTRSDEKDFTAALADIDSASALDPKSSLVMAGRGRVLTEKGDLDDARKAFDQAIAAEPDSAEAWFFRALLHDKTGRSAEMAEDTRKAIPLIKGDAVKLAGLGFFLGKGSQLDAAIQAFEAALAADPDCIVAVAGRGLTRAAGIERSTSLEADKASIIADFERVLAHTPKNAFEIDFFKGVPREGFERDLAVLRGLAPTPSAAPAPAAAPPATQSPPPAATPSASPTGGGAPRILSPVRINHLAITGKIRLDDLGRTYREEPDIKGFVMGYTVAGEEAKLVFDGCTGGKPDLVCEKLARLLLLSRKPSRAKLDAFNKKYADVGATADIVGGSALRVLAPLALAQQQIDDATLVKVIELWNAMAAEAVKELVN
jgi:tetratricopeptide (TPR) repeat protein